MKIVICDDRASHGSQTRDYAVRGLDRAGFTDYHIAEHFEGSLGEEIGLLWERARAVFQNKPGQDPSQRRSAFDDVDLVILDNNLTHLLADGPRLTAEVVAGYIRGFTNAKYIVSLNKNPDVDFDLRYLVGDYATVADLALNERHLELAALWNGPGKDDPSGFHPWYWPPLLREPERRRQQIEFVERNLSSPILGALGLPSEPANFISRHAVGALSPFAPYELDEPDEPNEPGDACSEEPEDVQGKRPASKVTFEGFFQERNRSFLLTEDRHRMMSEPQIVSRLVAADIDLWLRRDLMAPQDALVDVPHLLLRMPELLAEQVVDPRAWNLAAAAAAAPFGFDLDTYAMIAGAFKEVQYPWSWRPTFVWPTLREVRPEVRRLGRLRPRSADVVFCEDTSSFELREPADAVPPKRFEAEFEGSWTERYIKEIRPYRYVPRSRLAL